MSKRFTVLIPNGRGNEALNICLTSILAQTQTPKEIIVLLDHSENVDMKIINIFRDERIPVKLVTDSSEERMEHEIRKYPMLEGKRKENPPEPFKSIAYIRHQLLKECGTEWAVFVDDDMLLDRHAFEMLQRGLESYPNASFFEGYRREVGGREEDVKNVKTVTREDDNNWELPYGDTALLLINVEHALSVDWEKIKAVLGEKGLAGEDIIMTTMMIQKGRRGIACGNARGWHLGEADFSYWDNFVANDNLLVRAFPVLQIENTF